MALGASMPFLVATMSMVVTAMLMCACVFRAMSCCHATSWSGVWDGGSGSGSTIAYFYTAGFCAFLLTLLTVTLIYLTFRLGLWLVVVEVFSTFFLGVLIAVGELPLLSPINSA